MPFIDLKDFVVGIMTVIFISMAIGQYHKLQAFARRQAMAALKPWPAHHFFPPGYEVKDPHKYSSQNWPPVFISNKTIYGDFD